MDHLLKHILRTVIAVMFFSRAAAQDTVVVQPPVEVLSDTLYERTYTTSDEYYQFKEGITPAKIDARKIPEDELNSVRSDEAYWYVNEAPPRKERKIEEPKKRTSRFNQPWIRTLFWIVLIAGFVALLVWFLATSNISLFRRKQKTVSEEKTEEETGDIFEMNFEKEIQKAIGAGDYRMAVRLMYLRTLRDLSLRNLIQYTHEKTNSDYLLQLAGSPLYRNFFRLTRSFDYTWYGKFPLSNEGFTLVQNDFNNFKQQLA